MRKISLSVFAAMFTLGVCGASAAHDWRSQVPDKEKARENPFPSDAATVAAGAKVYAEHCAKCHGTDASGHGRRPSLRSNRVRTATDGELFWLLRNGELRYGMPSWSALPEEQRWQAERYIKSLPPDTSSNQR